MLLGLKPLMSATCWCKVVTTTSTIFTAMACSYDTLPYCRIKVLRSAETMSLLLLLTCQKKPASHHWRGLLPADPNNTGIKHNQEVIFIPSTCTLHYRAWTQRPLLAGVPRGGTRPWLWPLTPSPGPLPAAGRPGSCWAPRRSRSSAAPAGACAASATAAAGGGTSVRGERVTVATPLRGWSPDLLRRWRGQRDGSQIFQVLVGLFGHLVGVVLDLLPVESRPWAASPHTKHQRLHISHVDLKKQKKKHTHCWRGSSNLITLYMTQSNVQFVLFLTCILSCLKHM